MIIFSLNDDVFCGCTHVQLACKRAQAFDSNEPISFSMPCKNLEMGPLTWRPCWGDRGGDREEREGMLVMEGVPGMVRLDALCVPALTDSGPGALKKPAPPSGHVFIDSEPVSFMPAGIRCTHGQPHVAFVLIPLQAEQA